MIVAGFGFRQAASVDSLLDALDKARGTQAPGLLATAEDKATAPAFQALSDHLHLPVRAIAQDVLAQVETPTRSATVRALRGSGSVAEAAALVAAGPGDVQLAQIAGVQPGKYSRAELLNIIDARSEKTIDQG